MKKSLLFLTAAGALAPLAGMAQGAAAPDATSAAQQNPSEYWRYRVVARPDEPATADHFDEWLHSRGMKIVGGKVVPLDAAAAAPAAERAPAAAVAAAPASVPLAPAAAAMPSAVQLQVASFANRDNADRALARLNAAGITSARLSSVSSQGRNLWRLRVGASDGGQASELSSRIVGLGFAAPQPVRE